MKRDHYYNAVINWTGNKGTGTDNYRNYDRSYKIEIVDKATILGSSDPSFLGDKTRYNPEELLVASLSACHMLWYLHLCAENNVVVTSYIDHPIGIMVETENGGGNFKEVTLNPVVTINSISMVDKAKELHQKANELCFIANSVNFPVFQNPTILFDKISNS